MQLFFGRCEFRLDNGGKNVYKITRFGDVAQLGERRVRNAEVRGSIPLISTKDFTTRRGGFFYERRERFVFSKKVALGLDKAEKV